MSDEASKEVGGGGEPGDLGDGWFPEQADIRRVFEENIQPMWVTAASGIVNVNRAALRHYEYSRDEFLAMSIVDIDVAEGPARADVLATDAAPRGTGADSVVGRHRKKDGSYIDVELTSFEIAFAGRPATLVIVVDVPPAADRGLLLRDTLSGSSARDGH